MLDKDVSLFAISRGSVWALNGKHVISFARGQHYAKFSDKYFPTHGYNK